MSFRQGVNGFLARAKAHFINGLPVGVNVQSVEPSSQDKVAATETTHTTAGGIHHDHLRTRTGNGTWRNHARLHVEKELSLVKVGKAGYFKAYTQEFGDESNKVVFNVWVSPNPDHLDRRGNPIKRIFPRSIYRSGERVVHIPFIRGEQGPYLPASVLYGFPVDADRFPEKYHEVLKECAEEISRGFEVYAAHRKARRAGRSSV